MTLKPAHLQWSEDGSLRSLDFDDIYFQRGLGLAEKRYVFLEKNHLPRRFANPPENSFRIAELGFGSGLNFLLAAQLWQKTAPKSARLIYAGIEKHPVPLTDLKNICSFWPELQEHARQMQLQYPPPLEGFHHLYFLNDRINLMLLFGDVADVLPQLTGSFDAWYLDGFSPEKNPAMWAEKLFPLIAARTGNQGTLSTFSSAGAVRRGLQSAGFSVEKVQGFGVKRDMTVAQIKISAAAGKSGKNNIAVLGAGIAGAAAAFALAEKGYNVTVIDRQPEAAAETSGNPVGIVYPKLTLDNSLFGSFHQHGFGLTKNLVTVLRLPSWKQCGVVHLDIDDGQACRNRMLAERNCAGGYSSYAMTGMGNGLYQPDAGYLSPPEFCRALLDHPNIELRYSTAISSLRETGHDIIVIALGHGSKNFNETSWMPLQSLRGQISYLRETAQSKKIDRVFCHDGFISPAIGGIHTVGATFQREEPQAPQLRHEDHLENLHSLNRYMPALEFSEADITGGRAGYRTTSPDKLPLIGACPDYNSFISAYRKSPLQRGDSIPDVYISTGFGAHGMAGAPLAGEIIASLISGYPLPIPKSLLQYLAPERFILRDLKRGKI